MAEFFLYTDESGKLGGSPYTSFCGFVAHQSRWFPFSQEWNNLRDEYEVPAIHMAHINHPEFDKSGKWAKVQRKWGPTWDIRIGEMLKRFANLAREFGLVCEGDVVDSAHFAAMPDSDYKRAMVNPLYLSFYNVIRNSLDHLDFVYPDSYHHLAVVVDDDQEYSLNCYRLLNRMRQQFPSEIGKRVDLMGFGNDIGYCGLQLADMIAYESRAFMIAQKADSSAEPSDLFILLTNNGLHCPTLYTPEYLDLLNAGDMDKIKAFAASHGVKI